MKIMYVSNTAANSGAPKMLRVVADVLTELIPDYEECFVFPADLTRDVAREIGTVFFDQGLTFNGRVSVAEKILIEQKPDLVFINTLRVAAFAVASRNLNLPNIVYVHEMSDSIANLIQLGLCSLDIAGYADLMLWASSDALQQWEYITKRATNAQVLESCYTEKTFVPAKKAVPAKTMATFAEFPSVIMSVGAVCDRKGFDRFLDIADRFPSIPFVWVGAYDDGHPPSSQLYRQLVKNRPNVAVTGQVGDPSLLLKFATLVLILSKEDPNPLTIHEAVYNGFKYLATVEGLGEKRLPLSTGSAVLKYDEGIFVSAIERELDLDRQNMEDISVYREARRLTLKSSFSGIVRTEKHFSSELIDILDKSFPIVSQVLPRDADGICSLRGVIR